MFRKNSLLNKQLNSLKSSFSSVFSAPSPPPLRQATSAPQKARVAVVGSGRMGEIRAKAIYANPKFELAGIVDAYSMQKAQALGGPMGVPAYGSLQDLLRDQQHLGEELDGVVCSTPTHTHAPMVQESIDLGVKSGIFVEKPVDESAPQIEALFDKANRANLQLCCGFQRRFDPSYASLYDKVVAGHIGKPLQATIFFGDHPIQTVEQLLQGGDIFMDLSCHDLDFICQVMGPHDDVVSVYATGTSSIPQLEAAGIQDNATMVVNFRSGAVVTLFMGRSAAYGYDQRCDVFGTDGMVQVASVHENSTILSDKNGIHRSKFLNSFPQRFSQAFSLEMDAFADALLGTHAWPITEQDCIRVQRIADAAQESVRTGQVVELEPLSDDDESWGGAMNMMG